MSTAAINLIDKFSFGALFVTPAVEGRFNLLEFFEKRILESVATATVPAAKDILASINLKALQINSTQRTWQFLKSEKLALRELGP